MKKLIFNLLILNKNWCLPFKLIILIDSIVAVVNKIVIYIENGTFGLFWDDFAKLEGFIATQPIWNLKIPISLLEE